MYLMRLDDMSDHRDIEKWSRMEALLDRYGVKPIYGIIPDNKDPELCRYPADERFWETCRRWMDKGWMPAMHGYQHLYSTQQGGIHPVNSYSEFAGVALEQQRDMLRDGYRILKENGIEPDIFFAPAHTFDANTLSALKTETPVRVISDTVANDVYFEDDLYYIPQQTGSVRSLPLKVVTFCYHPNTMDEESFLALETFLADNASRFGVYNKALLKERTKDLRDRFLQNAYFGLRKLRRRIKGSVKA